MLSILGARILIVEDEFLVADDLARYFSGLGARILGPVPSVAKARAYADRADAAVLDIDLGGDLVFPIADRLAERGVPFVFFSAHGRNVIPARLGHVANLQKPADRQAIPEMLFREDAVAAREVSAADILSLLPKLRLAARLVLRDPRAADRLVEATLRLALEQVETCPPEMPAEDWLNMLFRQAGSQAAGCLN